MNKIQIRQLSEQQRQELNIPDFPAETDRWAVWECPPSTFDWHYSQTEVAYVYQGRVTVKTEREEVEIKAGDFVTFPAGLSCTWRVVEAIKKVYTFE